MDGAIPSQNPENSANKNSLPKWHKKYNFYAILKKIKNYKLYMKNMTCLQKEN